ncbi:hypothetical protein ABT095_17435 [Kitasatospora sp. NPDC002227]|uniref:hypothetical protein n=1 Tax=Kitasatospora sp. NPDC002227 TaxID=3154773 RepID=UPI00332A4A86
MRYVVGLAKALLWLVALLGVLAVGAWQLLKLLFDANGPDLTDTAGLGLYWDVAKLWAVGCGFAVLVRPRSLQWMAGWVLAMLTAFLWPVQAALFAGLAAWRSVGWRRVSTAVAGALLLAGGLGWGVTGYAAEQPWTGRSDAALIGHWRSNHGGTLELRADHTFTASVQDPDHDWASWPGPTSGHWALGGRSSLDLIPDTGYATELDLYGSASPATLCKYMEAVSPCYSALHRS